MKSWLRLLKPSHLLQMRGLKRLQTGMEGRQLGRIFYRCVD